MNASNARALKDYRFKIVPSPIGALKLVASERGLAAILWEDDDPRRVRIDGAVEDENDPILLEAQTQLDEYFARKRTTFTLDLDFRGTPFQREVWSELLAIPFGETRTYGEIAADLGRPNASRAVGAANGRNPIAIIAPCHRVVGSTGALTGFAGGLAAKAYLLNLEHGQMRFFP
ncbi:MAG TPA: methylated-DNA--[protein]-cysteine S-methyltransferase [Gemmatimonadaceae bacterium]|jgi:methylated-DNA-[protein]-cysteine S-methyltransferase